MPVEIKDLPKEVLVAIVEAAWPMFEKAMHEDIVPRLYVGHAVERLNKGFKSLESARLKIGKIRARVERNRAIERHNRKLKELENLYAQAKKIAVEYGVLDEYFTVKNEDAKGEKNGEEKTEQH